MTPIEILESVRAGFTYYLIDKYIDNLKVEGDFSKVGAEESMLSSAIDFYAANGNPNNVISVAVTESEEDSTQEIIFPPEFATVIQICDNSLQSVPHKIDTESSKIVVAIGPDYVSPYKIRYRYKLEDYFAYHVDGNGSVVVDTNRNIADITTVDLIKRLFKAKLKKYNNSVADMGKAVQMELPISEDQGEGALAEDTIRGQVRIQPSLMSF